jgi:hypothetical protein
MPSTPPKYRKHSSMKWTCSHWSCATCGTGLRSVIQTASQVRTTHYGERYSSFRCYATVWAALPLILAFQPCRTLRSCLTPVPFWGKHARSCLVEPAHVAWEGAQMTL